MTGFSAAKQTCFEKDGLTADLPFLFSRSLHCAATIGVEAKHRALRPQVLLL